VVGKFLADFQPGAKLAGGRDILVHGRWMAARNRTIFGGRNTVYVGHPGSALGPASVQLSCCSSLGAALGHAENRIRPSRSGVAGGDCGGTLRRLAVFARGIQYELCVSRSSLSSRMGTCSRTPSRDFNCSSRGSLLADPSALELDVSAGRRCEMK